MADSRLVYSTSSDNHCQICNKPFRKCQCREKPNTNTSSDGIIRLAKETKGRKGAGVTLISGFDEPEAALKKRAKQLKALCSSGGTVKNGIIEIQGDHREKLKAFLEKEHTVKISGA